MSQSRSVPPIADLLAGGAGRPDMWAWPPPEWVETESVDLALSLLSHRSGVRIVKMGDGTVIVHRGYGPEAAWVANLAEDFMWGSGFKLLAGGGPGDSIAVYVPPESETKHGREVGR